MHVNIYVYLCYVHRNKPWARIIYLELLFLCIFYARDVEMLRQKCRSDVFNRGQRLGFQNN